MKPKQVLEYKKWLRLLKILSTNNTYEVDFNDIQQLSTFIFDNLDTFKIYTNKDFSQGYFPAHLEVSVISKHNSIHKVFKRKDVSI